jgi:hypothetical protein
MFSLSSSFRTFLQNFSQTPYVTSKVHFLLINDCGARKTGSLVRMEIKTISGTNVKFSALINLATVLRPSLGAHNSARRVHTTGILADGGSPWIYCLFTCASWLHSFRMSVDDKFEQMWRSRKILNFRHSNRFSGWDTKRKGQTLHSCSRLLFFSKDEFFKI